jgi:hypothetical protein
MPATKAERRRSPRIDALAAGGCALAIAGSSAGSGLEDANLNRRSTVTDEKMTLPCREEPGAESRRAADGAEGGCLTGAACKKSRYRLVQRNVYRERD